MSTRTLFVVVLFLSFICGGRHASAETPSQPPSAIEIERLIVDELPSYWEVDRLDLTDPVNYGNQIQPDWRWRFQAVIKPKEPLYLDGGRSASDSVLLLQPSLGPKAHETLYGIFQAAFRAGKWAGNIQHENRPFLNRGKPASFFPGPIVVIGSSEERALEENVHRQALGKLKARHEAELAALKMEQQHALAKETEVHRTALASLEAENETARKRREVEHGQELAKAVERHSEQLAMLEGNLRAEAEQRRVEITEAVTLTELTAEATRKLATLQAAEAEMLTASEGVFEARQSALKELFDALGMVSGVDSYLALLETADDGDIDWMLAAVLRHGLEAGEPTVRVAAWRHLLQADLEGSPHLWAVLDDHLGSFKDSSRLRSVLGGHLASFKDSPRLQVLFVNRLPSIRQWAARVINASSSRSRFGPALALGRPAQQRCAAGRAWRPKGGTAEEFIRVAFAKPVLFPQIEVYETTDPGFVRKLILRDATGNGIEYEVQDALAVCPGVATFRLYEHPAPVAEVTLVIDGGRGGSIDAIELIGTPLE